ncbi:MAG: alpha/beta fold hydrolase [Pseudomonadales bacterium]|nr:alpha/beta fold hydrolase [Pseudomonadales bacterium]
MPAAAVNSLEIHYETFGSPSDPAILLIMGLGTQMIYWHTEFCQQLADNGYFVIRYDNRDVGKSSYLKDQPVPDLTKILMSVTLGGKPEAPYNLQDMAVDALGLLDHLGVGRAHVVGMSMGGMIAQTIAFTYPDRVSSLTSIMSSTGDFTLPQAKPEAMATLTQSIPATREDYIRATKSIWRVLSGPVAEFEEDRYEDLAGEAFDRGLNAAGFIRHFAAIITDGDRTSRLAGITTPTLVVHGTLDPLIPFEHGAATSRAIESSSLVTIEGMGHTLPAQYWPEIQRAILSLIRTVS